MISRQILLVLAGLLGSAAACSGGETGLVLGHPLPQTLAGGSGGAAGSGAAGGPAGTSPAAGSGAQPAAGNAGAGTTPVGGGGGAGGAGDDPAWIDERCTPIVDFSNNDTTTKGQLFTDAVPNPSSLVLTASHAACRVLYRAPEEVPPVTGISLMVGEYGGVASTVGTTMRLSTSYLQTASERGVDLGPEIAGILHFTTSLVYQNNAGGTAPVWLVTGIADFVRLQADLVERTPVTKGGNYDDSSQTTARLLDYLTSQNPDLVYLLNQRLETGPWSDEVFIELTGSDLTTLWGNYQATLPE